MGHATNSVRSLEPRDFPIALELIAQMFTDLGNDEIHESWAADAVAVLDSRLGSTLAAFVTVDEDDVPIAIAVGLIENRLPCPRRPNGLLGYVEWVATSPQHRRKGAARAATAALLEWFDAEGVLVIDIHASDAAAPLYESLGFTAPQSQALRRRR